MKLTTPLSITILILGLASSSGALAKDKTKIHGSIAIQGKSKAEYSTLAKISIQDAIAIATKAAEGKVIEAALDREDGFLVYEIEVLMPHQIKKELLIDAGDGKVLLSKEKKSKSSEENEDDE